MSLYKTPDKKSQRCHKTPQHSTPIKNTLVSPASSLSPVKHDFSTNQTTMPTGDSPSILRAGSTGHSSLSSWSEAVLSPAISCDDDVDNSSVKSHDIYKRLMLNTNHHKSNVDKDHWERKTGKTDFNQQQHGRRETVSGEGDSPRRDNAKYTQTDLSESFPTDTNRELSPLENSTVEKQRAELELMIVELRDRDRELNEMVASHQKQLLSWEMDRQIVLNLSQKCAALQAQLDKKTDQLHSVTVKLRTVKSELKQKDLALENTKHQLCGVSEQHSKVVLKSQDLHEMNTTLSESVRDMSTTLGELQAKEEQLKTLIQHKDNELVNASSQISDMIKKLKKLDDQYRDVRRKEVEGQKDVIEWKEKYAESRKQVEHLKGDLNRSNQEEEECKTEVLKYKQQLEVLKQQLMLAGERERRKDDMLALQKSKQERTDAELTHLRLLYERQQRDLSLLHLNLETTKQLLAKQRMPSSLESSLSDIAPVDHNITITSTASAQNGASLDSKEASLSQECLQRQPSDEGFRPLQYESNTSSASSLVPSEDKAQKTSTQPQPHSSVGDLKDNRDEGLKSSQQVGELFDDSLHHALKINSISAGLRSRYLFPDAGVRHSSEALTLQDNSSCNNGSRPNEREKLDKEATTSSDLVRLTRSQDIVAQHSQDVRVIESDPCLGTADDTSQNHNVNSHTAVDSSEVSKTSSSHSFYATPSSSQDRPLNETFQVQVLPAQSYVTSRCSGSAQTSRFEYCPEVTVDSEIITNGSPIIIQEPLFSVKMSVDSGLHSSGASTSNSGRITPALSSIITNEIPPSPCSTLERLLAESRIMVEQLEMNSAAALSSGSISTSDA